jgi:type II secretory ATPase GspE/PulE/Tfp pilus assembly ATPase PilB-like protein
METCLVLTSLTADDAAHSLAKLLEWGVQPTLLGTAVRLVISQRGLRKLCERCRVEYVPSRSQLEKAGIPDLAPRGAEEGPASDMTFYKPGGCANCGNTGYRGRLLAYEMMDVSKGVREAVVRGASRHEIRKIAVEEGMETIVGNALRHAIEGRTSLEESLKVE